MPRRAPVTPGLSDFVECLWLDDAVPAEAELTLASGQVSLVVRLSDDPARVQEAPDAEVRDLGLGVLGGARSSFYRKLAPAPGRPVRSVGVQFRAGWAAGLLRMRADELADDHAPLAELWGAPFELLRERLLDGDPLRVLEEELAARLPSASAPHAAVRHVLERLERAPATPIETLRAEVGLSHRRMGEHFRRAVGVGPKAYARLLRFQRAARELARRRPGPVTGPVTGPVAGPSWADTALRLGYSDQSHLCREFKRLAGCTPARYRPVAPGRPGHALPG